MELLGQHAGTRTNWSRELFVVTHVSEPSADALTLPSYRVETSDGEPLHRRFYRDDLQKVGADTLTDKRSAAARLLAWVAVQPGGAPECTACAQKSCRPTAPLRAPQGPQQTVGRLACEARATSAPVNAPARPATTLYRPEPGGTTAPVRSRRDHAAAAAQPPPHLPGALGGLP